MSISIYLSSLILTLYFAMGLQSAILTPIAACAQVNPVLMPCLLECLNNIYFFVQVVALVWFVVSYIPGGQTGLR